MLKIEPISAFQDNYIWCLHDTATAWVVDPGDAAPVNAFLEQHHLRLEGILITHHHSDHIGGLAELARRHTLTDVYGPNNPAIAGITQRVGAGDRIEVLGVVFSVIEVPGHTLDHIAFHSSSPTLPNAQPVLFCGDTLFAGGCGRLFEGSAEQMHASLQTLAGLPPATAVYCAHEYTLANLRFALAVEPDNLALHTRVAAARQCREAAQPTLPSSLQLELETNPFLRTNKSAVCAAAQQHGATGIKGPQVFAAIRRWKDHF